MGWKEGLSVLIKITAHMVRNGMSRDALGICLPRPQSAHIPAAWDLWELKLTPGREQDVPAEEWMMYVVGHAGPRFLRKTTW